MEDFKKWLAQRNENGQESNRYRLPAILGFIIISIFTFVFLYLTISYFNGKISSSSVHSEHKSPYPSPNIYICTSENKPQSIWRRSKRVAEAPLIKRVPRPLSPSHLSLGGNNSYDPPLYHDAGARCAWGHLSGRRVPNIENVGVSYDSQQLGARACDDPEICKSICLRMHKADDPYLCNYFTWNREKKLALFYFLEPTIKWNLTQDARVETFFWQCRESQCTWYWRPHRIVPSMAGLSASQLRSAHGLIAVSQCTDFATCQFACETRPSFRDLQEQGQSIGSDVNPDDPTCDYVIMPSTDTKNQFSFLFSMRQNVLKNVSYTPSATYDSFELICRDSPQTQTGIPTSLHVAAPPVAPAQPQAPVVVAPPPQPANPVATAPAQPVNAATQPPQPAIAAVPQSAKSVPPAAVPPAQPVSTVAQLPQPANAAEAPQLTQSASAAAAPQPAGVAAAAPPAVQQPVSNAAAPPQPASSASAAAIPVAHQVSNAVAASLPAQPLPSVPGLQPLLTLPPQPQSQPVLTTEGPKLTAQQAASLPVTSVPAQPQPTLQQSVPASTLSPPQQESAAPLTSAQPQLQPQLTSTAPLQAVAVSALAPSQAQPVDAPVSSVAPPQHQPQPAFTVVPQAGPPAAAQPAASAPASQPVASAPGQSPQISSAAGATAPRQSNVISVAALAAARVRREVPSEIDESLPTKVKLRDCKRGGESIDCSNLIKDTQNDAPCTQLQITDQERDSLSITIDSNKPIWFAVEESGLDGMEDHVALNAGQRHVIDMRLEKTEDMDTSKCGPISVRGRRCAASCNDRLAIDICGCSINADPDAGYVGSMVSVPICSDNQLKSCVLDQLRSDVFFDCMNQCKKDCSTWHPFQVLTNKASKLDIDNRLILDLQFARTAKDIQAEPIWWNKSAEGLMQIWAPALMILMLLIALVAVVYVCTRR